MRRKAKSVQKPRGRPKDIPQGIYLGVSVGAHKWALKNCQYFCQSLKDLYKSVHWTHTMYKLSIILNRVLCLLSLSLCLSRILCKPKLSIKPASFSVLCFPSLLPHAILFMIFEREGWEPFQPTCLKGEPREQQIKKMMDRGMASLLPTEKLERTKYASSSYKMHQYLLGHGYWSYVDGANDAAPESTHKVLYLINLYFK